MIKIGALRCLCLGLCLILTGCTNQRSYVLSPEDIPNKNDRVWKIINEPHIKPPFEQE